MPKYITVDELKKEAWNKNDAGFTSKYSRETFSIAERRKAVEHVEEQIRLYDSATRNHSVALFPDWKKDIEDAGKGGSAWSVVVGAEKTKFPYRLVLKGEENRKKSEVK